MEEKKSPKANLENKKVMFTQIGLIISLLIAWMAFRTQELRQARNRPELAPPDRSRRGRNGRNHQAGRAKAAAC